MALFAGVIIFFNLNRLLCEVTFFLIFFILIPAAIRPGSEVTITFIPSSRRFLLMTVATTSTRNPIFVTVTRTLPRPLTRNVPTRSLRVVSNLRLPRAALHVFGVVSVLVVTDVGEDEDGVAVAVVVDDGE